MVNELTKTLILERQGLEKLMELLKKQHDFIMEKNVFQLEAIVDDIEVCNKKIAQLELERRKILGNTNIKEFVNTSGDDELKKEFAEIKKIVQLAKFQKDTNEVLIKQQMSFNARIISLINPNRETNTYNSYGALRR
ncbi:MAG: flagellar protein FlgN [Clostridiaceae bacterium]|nr:flagellar protein FlgN [Clostridiaceae bacterium]